jgi:hypothetical protein
MESLSIEYILEVFQDEGEVQDINVYREVRVMDPRDLQMCLYMHHLARRRAVEDGKERARQGH